MIAHPSDHTILIPSEDTLIRYQAMLDSEIIYAQCHLGLSWLWDNLKMVSKSEELGLIHSGCSNILISLKKYLPR
jgi:hypothetical protein